ncbi:MAG TPA: hypothetical protein VMN37_12850 [Gemmatimonadales bacterium]|nr:hypothetical protein [Gemmatimonadales bacterium]
MRARKTGRERRIAMAAAGATAVGACALALRRWYRRWGASRGELRDRLPGDELPGRTFLIRPIDETRCRLIVRSGGALPWWLAPLQALVLDPGHSSWSGR